MYWQLQLIIGHIIHSNNQLPPYSLPLSLQGNTPPGNQTDEYSLSLSPSLSLYLLVKLAVKLAAVPSIIISLTPSPLAPATAPLLDWRERERERERGRT